MKSRLRSSLSTRERCGFALVLLTVSAILVSSAFVMRGPAGADAEQDNFGYALSAQAQASAVWGKPRHASDEVPLSFAFVGFLRADLDRVFGLAIIEDAARPVFRRSLSGCFLRAPPFRG